MTYGNHPTDHIFDDPENPELHRGTRTTCEVDGKRIVTAIFKGTGICSQVCQRTRDGDLHKPYAASKSIVFETVDELEQYMQDLNESGQDCTTAILDARGHVWLTYGEEQSGGGEYMECWLVGGDPKDPDDRIGGTRCEECNVPYGREPLFKAHYPVTLLHDLREDK